jgi:hypothetical protein
MLRLHHHRTALAALAAAAIAGAASPLAAQAPASPAALEAVPSGRATTSVTLRPAGQQGEPAASQAPPLRITIDYGQPHARGREIVGKVVPFDSVWRTGANEPTSLTTDVDLVIGGARVPKGKYTLYTLPSARGWKLIVSKLTGEAAGEYRADQDLARVDLRARTLREPLESFSIWLVPAAGPSVGRTTSPAGPAAPAGAAAPAAPSADATRGTLRLAWGTQELSTDWRVAP